MLETVGLSAAESEVYRALVDAVTSSAREMSATTGLDEGTVQRLLVALEEKGLAHSVEGHPGRFAANPPDVTLLPRLERRADDLEKARTIVSGLVESYRRNALTRGTGEVIEMVTGAAALRQRLRQVQDNARDELLWFCRAQYVAMPSGTNQAEFDALARGVGYRVLYEQAFFDDFGSVDNVVRAVRCGEVARAVPALPLRMAIADRSVAICPLAPAGSAGSPHDVTTAVIRARVTRRQRLFVDLMDGSVAASTWPVSTCVCPAPAKSPLRHGLRWSFAPFLHPGHVGVDSAVSLRVMRLITARWITASERWDSAS